MGSHAGVIRHDGAREEPAFPYDIPRWSFARGDGKCRRYSDQNVVVWAKDLKKSDLEAQSLDVVENGVVVAFDGYLHERLSLIALTRSPTTIGDAALVAAAYKKWGDDVFNQLVGEWSVALYDLTKRRLLLGVDFSGASPLYFSSTVSATEWSSELGTLLSATNDVSLSRPYLLGSLFSAPELGLTPYIGIQAVIPGTHVVIEDGGVRCVRDWFPDLEARIVYRRDGDYEDHFREVFSRAVGERMSRRRVWCEVSGGLDSSSIACMASRLVGSSREDGDALRVVSYRAFGGNANTDNEHMVDVHRMLPCKAFIIEASNETYFDRTEHQFQPLPDARNGPLSKLAGLMRDDDARVLMSGEGGDALMWQLPIYLPLFDKFVGLQLRELCLDLFRFARADKRSAWELLWRQVIRRTWWQPRRVPRVPNARWFSWRACHEYLLWVREHRVLPDTAQSSLGSRLSYEPIERIRRAVASRPERLTGQIDLSYPYLDRRLVQFMLAVPCAQKLRPGETRSLQRRALEGILPERVRLRTTKANGSGPFSNVLRDEKHNIEALIAKDSRLAALGLIQPEVLTEAVVAARNGYRSELSSIADTLVLESWLRDFETWAERGRRPMSRSM